MLNLILNRVKIINRLMSMLAMAVLFFMMLLTTFDVAARYLFSKPIQSTFELTEIMLATMVFFSLAFCQSSKGHISVDIMIKHFSQRTRKIFHTLNYLVTLSVLILIAWMSFRNGLMVKNSNDMTMILEIPIYPFLFMVSLGSAGMALEIVHDLILVWTGETK